ncbi:hypothetical protein B0J18DRAFT_241117 [Chaetomium sp. MPI-SDFR-AT-0129]|nr:hypothetical protein B0J18DRAFT_241117 [Chaetomium sp. MPI-SDFR-AT-0129]
MRVVRLSAVYPFGLFALLCSSGSGIIAGVNFRPGLRGCRLKCPFFLHASNGWKVVPRRNGIVHQKAFSTFLAGIILDLIQVT